MRVPHTIAPNTRRVYLPSRVTVSLLLDERARTLRAEDEEWDKPLPPTLVAICVESLVEHFQEKQVLEELPDVDRDLLYETLPTDLPLKLTVPILVNDIYWKRSAQERWTSGNYVKDYGHSWKRLYLERHVQDYLETMLVANYVKDDVVALMKLCTPYIRRLTIRQLQLAAPPPATDWEEGGDECSIEPEPTEHINLEPVLKALQQLQEVDLMFGVRECGMDFEWRMFKFSDRDCDQLGSGLNLCKHLKILRINRSSLNDKRLVTLLQHLVKNKTVTELDFSHCHISDTGALAIGKLITILPSLTKLNLCNNKIGAKGAQGLAYALVQGGSPLDSLSLRLNVIGEEGTLELCSALTKCPRPRELNLAGCGITSETAVIRVGQMLQQNRTLQHLDLTNNQLGEVGGEALELGLKDNTTLLRLDLRMTGIAQEQEFAINDLLQNNNRKWRRKRKRAGPLNEGGEQDSEEDFTLDDEDEEEELGKDK